MVLWAGAGCMHQGASVTAEGQRAARCHLPPARPPCLPAHSPFHHCCFPVSQLARAGCGSQPAFPSACAPPLLSPRWSRCAAQLLGRRAHAPWMWRPQSSKLSPPLARRCGAPTLRAERRPHASSFCWTCTAVACMLARRTPYASCKPRLCTAPSLARACDIPQPHPTLHSTPIAKRASTAARCIPPALLCATHIPLRPTRLSHRLHPTRCVSNHRVHCHPNPLPLFPLPSSTHLRTATPTPYPTFHSNAFACPPAPTQALAPPTLPPPALASTHTRPPMHCRPQLFSLLFPTFAANKSRPFARPGVASSDAPQCILCFFSRFLA